MLPWTGKGFKFGAQMYQHTLLIGIRYFNYGNKGAGVTSGLISTYEVALNEGKLSVIDGAIFAYAEKFLVNIQKNV